MRQNNKLIRNTLSLILSLLLLLSVGGSHVLAADESAPVGLSGATLAMSPMSNTIYVSAIYDLVDISSGMTLIATENIDNIEIEFSGGLSCFTALTAGQTVSNDVDMTPNAQDTALMAANPRILEVYHVSLPAVFHSLQTFGFSYNYYGAGVEIHVPSGSGTTKIGVVGDKVRYSSTYYLVRSATSQQYTVTYDANGGSGTLPAAETCYGGDYYFPDYWTLPTPPASDMIFYSWNTRTDGNGKELRRRGWMYDLLEMPQNNVTLYAMYRNERYIIDMQSNLPVPEGYASPDGIALKPGDVLRFKLDKSMFDWNVGERDLTLKVLEENKVVVRSQVGGASGAIESLEFVEDNGNVYIELKMKTNSTVYGAVNYRYLIYLAIDNYRWDNYGVMLNGTYTGPDQPNSGVSSYGRRSSSKSDTRLAPLMSSAATSSGTTTVRSAGSLTAAQVKTAVEDAKTDADGTTIVRLRGVGSADKALLKELATTAGSATRLRADSMSADGKRVDVRIALDPAKAKDDLNLAASISSDRVKKTKANFEKWYRNKVQVIRFEQKEAWGQPVEVAVLLDLTGFDTENLCFYTYDGDSLQRIEKPNDWIDSKGYLRFTTEFAATIIVSDGPLVK